MKNTQAKYTVKNGWSNMPNPEEWDTEKTLIFAFSSPGFYENSLPLRELKQKFPQSTIIGCSTSGEIQGPQLSDESIVVNFTKFVRARFKTAIAKLNSAEDSFLVGKVLSVQVNAADLRGVVIFSDGLKANGSSLIAGFNSGIDSKNVTVGGGLAGDGNKFQRTFVILNDTILPQHVAAVGFYGDSLEINTATKGGWDIFGPERTVTKSKGNVLYEIDGHPALDLYKEYLGAKASELPASGLLFPLQISPQDNPDKKLVRTILGIDEQSKSLIFAGDLPEGWVAQLMRANFERVIDGAGNACQSAHESLQNANDSELVITVSCVGRRLVLGERTSEELEAVASDLPKNASMIGFYSYGELSPLITGSPCELHNQSMTLFVISENIAA